MWVTAALVVLTLGEAGEKPARVAATGWAFSGIDQVVGETFLDRFATQLGAEGVKVTTPKDIAGVLGLERQRQLLGCANESSCLAELAGALGVDALLTGAIVKIGTGFTVTLRVIAVRDGAEIASASERVKDEDAVQDWLDRQARSLAAIIIGAVRHEAAPAPSATVSSSGPGMGRIIRWAPAVIGAGLLIGGVIAYAQSRGHANQLSMLDSSVGISQADIHAIRVQGETYERIGFALIGVGAAAVCATLLWVLLGSSAEQVAVVPVVGGAWAGVSVVLP